MNIYIYLKHFPPKGDRPNEGAAKYVHGMASGLVDCGCKVTVLCETEKIVSQPAKVGYMIESFSSPNTNPSFQLSTGLQAYVTRQPDNSLFVLVGMFHRSVYALSRLLRKHSIPYVVAPLDPYHPTIFQKNAYLKYPYWYLLERHLLAQAIAIQLLDSRHQEWLQKLGIKTPTLATPCGFFPEDVPEEASLRLCPHTPITIFFLGRLDTYNKGLDLLLEAFAQVQAEADLRLVIQGPDWGDRATLQAQAEQLGISDNVQFLDPDYAASPSDLIAQYDIICIPSRFEGFSQSALEAMLAARVLVISEIAGIVPHVQASGCGVVVQPEVNALKIGLLEILKHQSEWPEMGLRGRRYVLEQLNWRDIAADALNHYQDLMGEED
jgi:glycosyltransferase involved in cell wall biosynthesis